MQSHSISQAGVEEKPSSTTPSINAEHAAENQKSYNQFWLVHSELARDHPTKFVSLRDLMQIIEKHLLTPFPKTKYRVLDLGCGAGDTAKIVHDMLVNEGLEVELVGVDINEKNLQVAQEKNPQGSFHLLDMTMVQKDLADFDLVLCNFVLLENRYPEMLKILQSIHAVLSRQGIAIVTHNTAKVYDEANEWMSFTTKFEQNKRDYYDEEKKKFTRKDETPVKKGMLGKDGKQVFEFSDFFFRRRTYKQAYVLAELNLVDSQKPLGRGEDNIAWKSEDKVPPYRIDVLTRSDGVALKAGCQPSLA